MIQRQALTIMFRGAPADVVFEDHGHEPDCNAHVIEWWFVDEAMNDLIVSDEEEQVIYDQLLSESEKA